MEQLPFAWKVQPRDMSFLISPSCFNMTALLSRRERPPFMERCSTISHCGVCGCVCGGVSWFFMKALGSHCDGEESAVGCCRQRCPHTTCPGGSAGSGPVAAHHRPAMPASSWQAIFRCQEASWCFAPEVADRMWFSSLIPVPYVDAAQNIPWNEFGILTTLLSLRHAEMFLQVIPTKVFPAFF